jgi:hypothetical protein
MRANDANGQRFWWRFLRPRLELYRAIERLSRCIAITRVSKTVQPTFVPTDIVLSERLVVFAFEDDSHQALLTSAFHWWWALSRSSTMRTDVNYTPTDCFETFAQPAELGPLKSIGSTLCTDRGEMMIDRDEGLTSIYTRIHDPNEIADDIARLRALHVELDYAVRDAYGWTDLDLEHGFYETKVGTRYTFAPAPRQEVLDRLLELNHERYAEEVARGLHGKPKAKGRRKGAPAGSMSMELDGCLSRS